MLAVIIFSEPGKALGWEARKPKAPPGRHKKWDPKRRRLFQRDIAIVMIDENGQFDPYMKLRKIRQRLQKQKKFGPFKLGYSAFKNSTLEKYIERALLPPSKSRNEI